MKTCPFCAEEIQNAAIKCRYCGSQLGPDVPPVAATTSHGPIVEHTPPARRDSHGYVRGSSRSGGLSGIDVMGWISIVLGAASSIIGVAALFSPDIDPFVQMASIKSLAFAALALAYGQALVKRKKVALARGWSLIPFVGGGLTPMALTGIALMFWFTQHLRKQPHLFT